jgi:hypothetical protein
MDINNLLCAAAPLEEIEVNRFKRAEENRYTWRWWRFWQRMPGWYETAAQQRFPLGSHMWWSQVQYLFKIKRECVAALEQLRDVCPGGHIEIQTMRRHASDTRPCAAVLWLVINHKDGSKTRRGIGVWRFS